MAGLQKQMQKRYVNPHVQLGGGVRLRGLTPSGWWNPNIFPEVSITVDPGGELTGVTLISDNEDAFEFLRVEICDAFGNYVSANFNGSGSTDLDTSVLNTQYSSTRPGITIRIVWKLKGGIDLQEEVAVLDYYVPLDSGTFQAGVTIDTSNRLNTTDSGATMAMDVVYTESPDTITATITSIASIGLGVELFQDGVSIGTGVFGSDGIATVIDSATLSAGTYLFKAVITTASAAQGSFVEYTLTV